MLATSLLGWWGIPWGLIKTPLYIFRNYKAKKENRIANANHTLLFFTHSNIGMLETYKNDPEKLKEIIKPK